MDWSNFIFPWLEWPLKITIGVILITAMVLFWNNVILLVFRGTALTRAYTTNQEGEREWKYVPTDGMSARHAWLGQFGEGGRFHNLFKWYGWFWFRSRR